MTPCRDTPTVCSCRLSSRGRLVRGTSVSVPGLVPVFVEHRIFFWCRYFLLRRFARPVTWPRRLATLGPDFYVGSSLMDSRDSALETWSLVASHFERGIALAEEYPFVVRDAMMISLSRGLTVTARWPGVRHMMMCEVYLRIDHGPSYDRQEVSKCVGEYKTLVEQVLCSLAEMTKASE